MIWQKPSRVQLAGWISAIVFSLVGTVAFATAERVISFAPHATELAYAAGLGDSLIAASDYSDYPPEANRLERVASWQGINLERVLALKPDLILAWRGGNPQKVLDQLSGFGIPIVYTDADTIDGIAADLSQLAPYSPHPEEALQAAQKLLEQKAALEKRYKKADAPPINVFLQFSNQPLFTASGKTLQSEVVALCGGKNVFADSPAPWPQVSREQVLARRPEAILIAGDGSQEENVRAFWRGQLEVPIISVPEDWFNRSGPRIMLAAEAVCQKLSQISSGS